MKPSHRMLHQYYIPTNTIYTYTVTVSMYQCIQCLPIDLLRLLLFYRFQSKARVLIYPSTLSIYRMYMYTSLKTISSRALLSLSLPPPSPTLSIPLSLNFLSKLYRRKMCQYACFTLKAVKKEKAKKQKKKHAY